MAGDESIALPHRDALVDLFGPSVPETAIVSPGACDSLDAEAFTHDGRIAFADRAPTLDTAAHEVAHAVLGADEPEAEIIAARAEGGAPVPRAPLRARSGAVQAKRKRPGPPPVALDARQGNATAVLGRVDARLSAAPGLVAQVIGTLLPAFRSAVGAHDAAAALELGSALTSGVNRLEDDLAVCAELLHYIEDLAESHDALSHEHGTLAARLAGLRPMVQGAAAQVAAQVAPHAFTGAGAKLPKADGAVASDEAEQTIGLLFTVDQVKAVLGHADGECAPVTPDARREAAALIEKWRGRPANWQFLVQTLRAEGLWQIVADVPLAGHTLAAVDETVQEQADETGVLADVGGFDASKAKELLGKGVDEKSAAKVFEMVASASPSSRGPLVKQLARSGQLDAFCANLPAGQVQALMDTLDDREAKVLLSQRLSGRTGGQSVTSWIEHRQADKFRIAEEAKDRWLETKDPRDLWTQVEAEQDALNLQMLETGYHALTFGFARGHDQHYDAREQGLITDDAFRSGVTKEALKATATFAATMLVGGGGSAFATRFAQVLGAGEGFANVLGGVVGGGLGNVAGVGVNDAFEGELSSGETYRDALWTGAWTGGLTAGIGALGARYLPEQALTMAQTYALKYPRLDRFFRVWGNAGFQAGARVRVTVAEIRQLVAQGLLPPPEAELALAYAGIRGPLAAAPDELAMYVKFSKKLGEGGPPKGTPPGDPDSLSVKSAEPAPKADGDGTPTPTPHDDEIWLRDLETRLSPEAKAKLDKLRQPSASATRRRLETMARGADETVDEFLQQTGAKEAATAHQEAEGARQSQERRQELSPKLRQRRLWEKEAFREVLEGNYPEGPDGQQNRVEAVRGVLGEEIAYQDALGRTAADPTKQVLRSVLIYEIVPGEFPSLSAYRAASRFEGPAIMRNGRVFKAVTDIDILVLEARGGRLRFSEMEQVKTGSNDRPGNAKHQNAVAMRALRRLGTNPDEVLITAEGRDITNDLDVAGSLEAKQTTVGPAGTAKSWDRTLGMSTEDLDVLAREIANDADYDASVTR